MFVSALVSRNICVFILLSLICLKQQNELNILFKCSLKINDTSVNQSSDKYRVGNRLLYHIYLYFDQRLIVSLHFSPF